MSETIQTYSSVSDPSPVQRCEVCDNKLPAPVLDLGRQPLCDDLIPLGDATQNIKYLTQISLCETCLTAHQVYRVPKETLFPATYHYRPQFTQDVLDGMKGLVRECEERFVHPSKKVVCDIGCNDGSLLAFFKERNATTCGIEPTDAYQEALAGGHQVINDYFTIDSARLLLEQVGKPDIITLTNVFAHLDSLYDAIQALREMCSRSTLLVIENHYLGSIIDTNQFDTFYHEHPRTYSLRSFIAIAQRLGGEILHVSLPRRYGGNIRVFIGNFGQPLKVYEPTASAGWLTVDESTFVEQMARMQARLDHWKQQTNQHLSSLRNRGILLHGKSFPGRASILINLLDLDCDLQPRIFEKPDSKKVGHYAPGTRIPIVDDSEWIKGGLRPTSILIWAWHIAEEVATYMHANGYEGKLFVPLPSFQEIT